MSALDTLIRHLMAQRASLERAAAMVSSLPRGPAVVIGWGDGAAYDHWREILRRREVFVFDRAIPAPSGAPPPTAQRILGDPSETLPDAWERWPREVALACLNFPPPSRLALELAPLLAPLLRPGAVIVSPLPVILPGWEEVPAPEAQRDLHEHLYKVAGG